LDIKLMHSKGLSIKEIAKRSGRDRKTIAKYLQCQKLPKYKPRLGYSSVKTILKDFVKPFRPLQKAQAVSRFETKPGEQAQVDFGVFKYEEQGRERKVYAFVMVMSYSKAMSEKEKARRSGLVRQRALLAYMVSILYSLTRRLPTYRRTSNSAGSHPAYSANKFTSLSSSAQRMVSGTK